MTTSIWAWLTAADSWRGPDGIPTRLQEHLSITALVLLIASAIAIPLGLWIGHSGRGRWLVALANSARAVPTLGLLFALSLWIGPHITSDLAFTIPSIVVLVLLAIPPILSGTYAGVDAVDPAARDAARGLGLTRWGVLRQVELPCALPLLLSGFRSATLQVASTATIAAAIGLGGLGRYLIDGIAAGDYAATAGGAVLVAVLAVALDVLLALLTRVLVSPGLRTGTGRARRRRTTGPDDAAATAVAASHT